MNNKTFGFAIVGTGAIADIHAQAIQQIPNAHLRAVFNRTQAKASEFAKKHNCAVYTDLHKLAGDETIDIVCICTASGAHLEPALVCLEQKKHCLIEKPLEINSERSRSIIAAAKANNCKLGVIFPSRFYPDSERIKDAMSDNRIGIPVLASAYVKWHRTKEYYGSADWRGTWALDGGGCLMNQAIHTVDLLQWFMGPVHSVQAITANRVHTSIEVEDTVVAILQYKSGAVGTIEATTAGYPGDFRKIEIIGSEGSVTLEDNTISKWVFKTSQEAEVQETSVGGDTSSGGGFADPMSISFQGHKLQMIDFIEAIANDTTPVIDGHEGLESIKIIEAIYESARTSSVVYL